MREKITIEGRSMIFNVVFVVLNLIGLVFMVMGYHESAGDASTLYKSIGWILMMLSIGGLVMFRGKFMMSSVARVLVGGLFIVSGLVKANDPIGFSYKLEEYFEDGALAYRIKELFGAPGFSLEFFIDWALFLSVLICIAEIVLGVLTIIGGKIKLVSYLMMIMMVFFTFLTWHTSTCDADSKFVDHDTYDMSDPGEKATANLKINEAKEAYAKAQEELKGKKGKKVDKEKLPIRVVSQSKEEVVIAEYKSPQCVADCGCFGDAMKGSVGRSLTPDESLWKDIILLYLTFWIFIAQWIVKPNTRKENMVYVPASMLVVIFFSWIFGWYFPVLFAIISIVGALWILRVGKKILGNYYGSALLVTVLCVILVTYVLMYVPLKDYRPYAVGSNLIEKMNDGVEGEYEYYYFLTDKKKNKKERVQMSQITQEMWGDTERWKAEYDTMECVVTPVNASIMDFNPSIGIDELSDDERNSILVKSVLDTSMVQMLRFYDKGYESEGEIPLEEYEPEAFPPEEYDILDTVTSYSIEDVEIKDAILQQDKIAIVVSRKLEKGSWLRLDRLKAIQEECEKNNVPFIVICNATREEINAFKKKNDFNVPIFSMDEIELKVISRSNPSLLVLEKAVVKDKYPFRSTPSVETFKNKHLK